MSATAAENALDEIEEAFRDYDEEEVDVRYLLSAIRTVLNRVGRVA